MSTILAACAEPVFVFDGVTMENGIIESRFLKCFHIFLAFDSRFHRQARRKTTDAKYIWQRFSNIFSNRLSFSMVSRGKSADTKYIWVRFFEAEARFDR